ncbi:hypothetical protein [Candidatus Poriferisodalis sp.]|uniref:hypothetical protein n=1 Tax=Candidatus Poriferisodalis sp. TaxID=3101277 RepID=UPI003B01E548
MRRTLPILAVAVLAAACTAAGAQTDPPPTTEAPPPCPAPVSVNTDLEVSYSTVRLNWTRGGETVTGHEVKSGRFPFSTFSFDRNRNQLQFGGIEPTRDFTPQVRSVCGDRRSDWVAATATQTVILGHWLAFIQEQAGTLWPADTTADDLAALTDRVAALEAQRHIEHWAHTGFGDDFHVEVNLNEGHGYRMPWHLDGPTPWAIRIEFPTDTPLTFEPAVVEAAAGATGLRSVHVSAPAGTYSTDDPQFIAHWIEPTVTLGDWGPVPALGRMVIVQNTREE